MNNTETKIFVFTLPQEIVINEVEKKLICNIVVMPKFNPVLPLAGNIIVDGAPKDFVPFTESDIQFNAFLVKGNEVLPTLLNHDDSYAIAQTMLRAINPNRKEIFAQLETFFKIHDDYGRGKVTTVPIKKYLPQAYRNAFGFAGTRQGAVTDDSYFCALKENTFAPHDPPADKDHVNWSQVMAFCLHQPELAKQVGILYQSVEMNLPSADYFKDGGWVYADMKEDTSYGDLPGENIQHYAAWIPTVTESRKLFSPVLFPVEDAAAPETLDDIFDEVLRYNDGMQKLCMPVSP